MEDRMPLHIGIDPGECRPGRLVAQDQGNIFVADDSVTVTLQGEKTVFDIDLPDAYQMNAGDENFHVYSNTHVLGRAGVEITDGPGHAYRVLTESPGLYPAGNSNETPVPSGDVSTLPIMGDVATYRDDADMTVLNVTQDEHKLHPGLVSRQISEVDGCFVVTTSGIGVGDWGATNSLASNRAWGYDANRISIETVYDQTHGQISPDPRITIDSPSPLMRETPSESLTMEAALNELDATRETLEQTLGDGVGDNRTYQALTHPDAHLMMGALIEDGAQKLDVMTDMPSDPEGRAAAILGEAYRDFHERDLNLRGVERGAEDFSDRLPEPVPEPVQEDAYATDAL